MRTKISLWLILLAVLASAPPAEAKRPAELGPRAAAAARHLVGIPYRWGGTSPGEGFDCSGLVVYVYRRLGVWLPRTAAEQFSVGRPVSLRALRPGDLVDLTGAWNRAGVFDAYNVADLRPAGYGGGYDNRY